MMLNRLKANADHQRGENEKTGRGCRGLGRHHAGSCPGGPPSEDGHTNSGRGNTAAAGAGFCNVSYHFYQVSLGSITALVLFSTEQVLAPRCGIPQRADILAVRVNFC